jgi:pentatricopeptide repeat protein
MWGTALARRANIGVRRRISFQPNGCSNLGNNSERRASWQIRRGQCLLSTSARESPNSDEERPKTLNKVTRLLDPKIQALGSVNEANWREAKKTLQSYADNPKRGGLVNAFQLLDRMLDEDDIQHFPLDCMNQIISFCSNTYSEKNMLRVDFLFRKLVKRPDCPTDDIGTTYRLLLDCWTKSNVKSAGRRSEELLKQLFALQKHQPQKSVVVKIDLMGYNRIINKLAKDGNMVRAEALLKQILAQYLDGDKTVKPDMISFHSVLKACAKSRDPKAGERAESILHKMKELYQSGQLETVKPDARTYSTVLGIWVGSNINRAAERAVAILDEMEDLHKAGHEDIQPDKFCYISIIGLLCKQDDKAAEAEQILRRMNDMGLTPTLELCNSVLNCWTKSSSKLAGKRAEALLQDMLQDSFQVIPDTASYTIVINAYARVGNPDRAETIFNEMLQQYVASGRNRIKPNTRAFCAVLNALSRSGSLIAAERAELVLIRMQELYDSNECDSKPNTMAYNSVINCWAQSKVKGAGDRAENILRIMQELYLAGDEDVKPNSITYNTVINAHANSAVTDPLFTLSERCVPVHKTPHAIARAVALVQEMVRLVSEGREDMMPSGATYHPLLKIILASNMSDKEERAQKIRDIIKQRGFDSSHTGIATTQNKSNGGGARQGEKYRERSK